MPRLSWSLARVVPRFAVAATLAASVVAIARADEVRLVPGSTVQAPGGLIRGAIEKETPNDLTIAGKTVPVDQISRVDYDNPGASFAQGVIQENNGNDAQAADLFQKAVAEASTGKPLVAQEARFRRAAALARIAQRDPNGREAALKELESLSASAVRSRQYGPILELLAGLKLDAGDAAGADAALRKLATLPWAANRAAVLQARVQANQGKYEEALSALDRLIGTTAEGSPQRRDATLARSEALAGLKKYEEAEQAARSVIDAAGPEDAPTLALAYNTLGDCLSAAGRDRDALFAYLHTDILYPASADAHARALAQIALLWRKLNQPGRADAAVERLKQTYPRSPHLAEATAAN
jgi:tetratricopeptide (TPR) repeat protein